MFEAPTVSFKPGQGFSIVGAVILVDGADFEGVRIAVQNLSQDFGKVAGIENIVQDTTCPSKAGTTCIIIGSTSQSSIINALRDSGKLDTSGVDGKWETWMTTTVENPFEGYSQALVIVGSDKRGTIYGTYSLSEQIGISP